MNRHTRSFLAKPAIHPLAICLLGLSLLLPLAAQARVEMLDRIVAVVNDGVIMNSELQDRVAEIGAQFQADNRPIPPLDVMRDQVLDRMHQERIDLQLADSGGIRVDDASLNQALAGIARQNNMNLEQFVDAVRSQGQDWSRFREQIRNEMVIDSIPSPLSASANSINRGATPVFAQ